MKAIVSMIVALGLASACSGSALAAAGAISCANSKDCPSSMHCRIKPHHNTGLCVGAHAQKKSSYYY
jgi:hypothetical protein